MHARPVVGNVTLILYRNIREHKTHAREQFRGKSIEISFKISIFIRLRNVTLMAINRLFLFPIKRNN